ncbi:MAG: hypothetical protein Q8K02_08120 [Flavobacterium sp.]|nr:hypothetical protein [Flavobacterium sp.]
MKITNKQYQCPACRYIYSIATNHFGETYGHCPKCKSNLPQQCIELEAIAIKRDKKYIQTIFHCYRFNILKENEENAYISLRETLAKTRNLFASISTGQSEKYRAYKRLDNTIVNLDSEWITNNQWNTEEGFRVFDWSEPIYPNPNIKDGIYLDITPEMLALRNENWSCYYCGTILKVGNQCNKHKECPKYGMKSLKFNKKEV